MIKKRISHGHLGGDFVADGRRRRRPLSRFELFLALGRDGLIFDGVGHLRGGLQLFGGGIHLDAEGLADLQTDGSAHWRRHGVADLEHEKTVKSKKTLVATGGMK